MPGTFVTDMFSACLSGTMNKHVCVAPYYTSDPSFEIRGKFWACPTGDPNAGKSPVYQFVLQAFVAMMNDHRKRFPFQRQGFMSMLVGTMVA